jgi:hypothetical protein
MLRGALRSHQSDYDVVTTDFPREAPNPVIFAPTVVFSILLVWFLGGGARAGDVGKIAVSRIATLSVTQGPARWGALQMTFNSNRMITIKIIRLMPPPP